MLRGEKFAGTAQPRLYFIRHQEHVVLLADLRDLLQVPRGRNDDSAFALDRFEHYGGSIRRDRFFDGVYISIGHVHKARCERTEIIPVGWLRGETDNRDRSSMEVTRGGDDLCLVARHTLDLICPLARQLERRLDGF